MANNYLTSIGIEVKVNSVAVAGAISFGDIGGSPNTLDATKLTDTVRKYEQGVQDYSAWDLTYLFNNNEATSDYRLLQAISDAKTSVPIEVSFSDGTKFTNTGKCANRVTGAGVDAMIEAVATFTLQDAWTVTNPSSST